MELPDSALLLGVDFGTGGCKVTAVRSNGCLVASASEEYVTYHDCPGHSEQDPADWYPAMRRALAELESLGVDLAEVCALSLDGSTHNAVLLDAQMHPLRRVIMWTDQRSVAECGRLRRIHGDKIFETTYQSPAPTWTLPQLMWLEANEPEVIAKTRHLLFVKDYVRYLLTGVCVTDHIEAQGTLFYDMKRREFSEELVALCGLSPLALPELVEPTEVVGCITRRAAGETRLREGIPVVCGASDSAVEDFGAGAVEPGDLVIKLATAGNVNIMTSEARPSRTTLTYGHIVPGMWYSVSATNSAALCQRWMRDTFMREACPPGRNVYDWMDEEAAHSPIGAGGVFFHPYLQGERSPYWDADLRASFCGVSIASGRCDFLRALLEGVAFSLRDCYESLRALEVETRRIFLIGGGAKSALWSKIVCNVMNLPLAVPYPADASFGAALLAGVGAGVFPDAATAVRCCLTISRDIVPDKPTAEIYDEQFLRYKQIVSALRPVYSTRVQGLRKED